LVNSADAPTATACCLRYEIGMFADRDVHAIASVVCDQNVEFCFKRRPLKIPFCDTVIDEQ
jgi:hypothetical protein